MCFAFFKIMQNPTDYQNSKEPCYIMQTLFTRYKLYLHCSLQYLYLNDTYTSIYKEVKDNSLAFQWSGLGIFTAMAQVQFLVDELRSYKPCSMAKKKKETT